MTYGWFTKGCNDNQDQAEGCGFSSFEWSEKDDRSGGDVKPGEVFGLC